MSRTLDRSNGTKYRRPGSEASGWRRRIRVVSVGTVAAGIVVLGSLTLTSYQEASAATVVRAAVVPVAVVSQSSRTAASTAGVRADMAGMDMSGGTPSPASSAGMPANMPGMDMSGTSSTAPTDRPLGPVLGIFGGAVVLVLLAGALIRRKNMAAGIAKKAARTSRRA